MERLLVLLALLLAINGTAWATHPPVGDVSDLGTCTATRDGRIYSVLDGETATDCTTGEGSNTVLCQCDNGTGWVVVTGAGGTGDIESVWTCTTGDCSDLTATTGDSLDASAADTTSPCKSGTSPPGTCTVDECFIDTDATPGENILVCTSTNNWTVQGGAISLPVLWSDASEPILELEYDAGSSSGGQYDVLVLSTTTTGDESTDFQPGILFRFTDDTSTDQDLARIFASTPVGVGNEDYGEIYFQTWNDLWSQWLTPLELDRNGYAIFDSSPEETHVSVKGTDSILEFEDIFRQEDNELCYDATNKTLAINSNTQCTTGTYALYVTANSTIPTALAWFASESNGSKVKLNTVAAGGKVTVTNDSGTDRVEIVGGDAGETPSFFTSPLQLIPTDTQLTCSGNEGAIYYDASLQEPCFCDGTNWQQFDGGGTC